MNQANAEGRGESCLCWERGEKEGLGWEKGRRQVISTFFQGNTRDE